MRAEYEALRWSVAMLAVLAAGSASAQAGGREVPAEDTAAAVVDPDWEAPRTSWGHPSFEGVWSTDDLRSVPRNRPEEFGTREKLTREEFEERAAADAETRDFHVNEQNFSSRGEAGIRTFGYTSLVIDPADGRIPPLVDGIGDERRTSSSFDPGPFDDFDDFSLYDRCITRGLIGSIMPVVYGNGVRINQTMDAVAITYEMIHDTRIIKLDGRPRLDDDIKQYMGHSRGYWDGDTLVVETQNLTDKTSISGSNVRHTEAMKITERFTRVDPDMIEYIATVDDPHTYTEPFTFRLMLTTQPNYRVYEYSCHEGNGAIKNSLMGERDYERRVAEAIENGEPIPERTVPVHSETRLENHESLDFIDVNAGELE